jgi:hypothetical protein
MTVTPEDLRNLAISAVALVLDKRLGTVLPTPLPLLERRAIAEEALNEAEPWLRRLWTDAPAEG